MMLPTTLPLLDIFRRMIDARPDRVRLLAMLIAGYILTWAAFGVGAHVIDALLHRAVRSLDWLVLNGWAIGALVLALAGLFQFSRLKFTASTNAARRSASSHITGAAARRFATPSGSASITAPTASAVAGR